MITPELDDVAALRRWSAGDTDAGNVLVRRHFGMVFRFFRSKVNDGVEDLVQDTFVACLERADSIEGDTGFRPYLLGVARRRLMLRFRKTCREGRALDLKQHSVAQLLRSPSAALALHDDRRLLLEAMRSLPVDLQIIVELYYWESLPVADIACVVDIPPGTVKSRLHRARELLKESLKSLALNASPELRRHTVDNIDQWAHALGEPTAWPGEKVT